MAQRILVISQRFWPENHKINDICEDLVERGCHVDVICGQPNYPSGQFFDGYHTFGHKHEKHRGMNVFRTLEFKRDTGTAFRVMLNYLGFSFAAGRAARSLGKNEYDGILIYQNTSVMSCTPGLKLGKKHNIPVVIYALNIWPEYLYDEIDMQSFTLRKIFKKISEKRYLAADHLIVANKKAQDYFEKTLHVLPGRISMVTQGPDRFEPDGKADIHVQERFAGSFNIVCMDSGFDRQDYETIFAAARNLLNSGIRDVKIICVGNSQPGRELLRKVNGLRLDDMIFFEVDARRKRFEDYYRIADAFMDYEKKDRADEYETPDNVVNFMQFGKPIVTSAGTESSKIVRTARCGFIADSEDTDSLTDALMKLYGASPEKVVELGFNAIRYQEKFYNREVCIDKILEILSKDRNAEEEFTINENLNLIRVDDILPEGKDAVSDETGTDKSADEKEDIL